MSGWRLRLLGALGFAGVFAMIATDIIGSLSRPRYHPLSDTISLLAYHRLTGPQDIGLFVLAVGCFACGLGLFAGLRAGARRVLLFALMTIAALAILTLTLSDVRIAPGNVALQVHVASTLAVGAAILAASLLLPFSLPPRTGGYRRFSFITAALLVALASLYPEIPSSAKGLYERLVVADGLAFIALVSWLLVRAGAHPHKEKGPPANREP